MSYIVGVHYEDGKIKLKPGSVIGEEGDQVEFRFTGRTSKPATFYFYAWDDKGGTAASPFVDGDVQFEITTANSPVTKTLSDTPARFAYKIAVDGHVIDPVIIIEPTFYLFEAPVTAVSVGDSSFEILGSTIVVSQATSFLDTVDNNPLYNLADVAEGHQLEVGGTVKVSTGVFHADSVVRRAPTSSVRLDSIASVDDTARTPLSIAGVPVVVTNETTILDTQGRTLTPSDFLATAHGERVSAVGTWDSTNVTASRLQLIAA